MPRAPIRSPILVGDCRAVLPTLPASSFDACVTDPPYGLRFMSRRWDYDVPHADTWREVLRVLKPGAHCLAFFSPRTYHRGVVQLEDAGFEIRDCLAWVYGSGFPKSLDLGDGWGTALKPAHEPIVLVRRPVEGATTANHAVHGTGGLAIDACRVPWASAADKAASEVRNQHGGRNTARRGTGIYSPHRAPRQDYCAPGRWPTNVVHDGSDDAREALGGDGSRFFYCAKASGADRDEGVSAPLLSGGALTDRADGSAGLRSPRAGAGRNGGRRNSHPTVKPSALMRWLVRLVTVEGGRVLDPFAGSGSTGKAAALERRRFLGVELDPAYAAIARERISHAMKNDD